MCAILSIWPTRIDYTPMRVILYATHSTSVTRFDSSLSVKVVDPPITNTCRNFISLSHVPSSIILAGQCVFRTSVDGQGFLPLPNYIHMRRLTYFLILLLTSSDATMLELTRLNNWERHIDRMITWRRCNWNLVFQLRITLLRLMFVNYYSRKA
jgi:hypothetical protein